MHQDQLALVKALWWMASCWEHEQERSYGKTGSLSGKREYTLVWELSWEHSVEKERGNLPFPPTSWPWLTRKEESIYRSTVKTANSGDLQEQSSSGAVWWMLSAVTAGEWLQAKHLPYPLEKWSDTIPDRGWVNLRLSNHRLASIPGSQCYAPRATVWETATGDSYGQGAVVRPTRSHLKGLS